jgi:hypothetical protein
MRGIQFIASVILSVTTSYAQVRISIDSLRPGEAEEFTELCFYTIPPTQGSASPQAMAVDKESGGWLIRVNGKLHHLKILNETSSTTAKQKAKIGDSFEQVCSDGELKATLKYRIKAIGTEATIYEGHLVLSLGKSTATFKVVGNDGC